ncbi:MAG: hypothetical protein OEM24_06515 [Paracoccaceae bacterium]|nr:hypothetical protein [Paracoccaceae bacterium]
MPRAEEAKTPFSRPIHPATFLWTHPPHQRPMTRPPGRPRRRSGARRLALPSLLVAAAFALLVGAERLASADISGGSMMVTEEASVQPAAPD